MASSKDYLQFILEQLSDLEEITYRAMMGEYILYYRGKIVGGIYDDRLLVKPVKSACRRLFMNCLMRAQKKCYLWTMLTIKSFWQDFFVRCMMNCRHRKRKK